MSSDAVEQLENFQLIKFDRFDPSTQSTIRIARSPKPIPVKVVIVGDGGCGKTCLLNVFATGTFPEAYVPTIIENVVITLVTPTGQIAAVTLWDTAGQEEYDRLRPLSYSDVDVVLLCYSIDNLSTFHNVADKWYPEVAHFCPNTPIILVGTKSDMRRHQKSQPHFVSPQDSSQLARQMGAVMNIECSAKEVSNVNIVFDAAVSYCLSNSRPKTRGDNDNNRSNRRLSRAKRASMFIRGKDVSSTSGNSREELVEYDQDGLAIIPDRKKRKCSII
ncbi:Small GTPase of the Rho/Rac subfamily of Ras-like proteins [Komagataella phaffii CBS 7435]|uniref:Non-essential small GTPase of the Rho/Rac subfamily of Ras-like proteins n=2 Tax=Komagataella phaffii TaxID=460519 RepID=C4R509_KOMPG|nr:uncharacterized protein PAS_chr3_0598 [Komagataella phaffii GS115]CAH2449586.1 Small GTPase of the Rho/Rac subfamily of Ras-like proteins [Komagataella phaffii CBS 7435]CAY70645.1 Non-essential small GTPase of the Rho/Rac subfamily of Ras-like proteins [Komagataella phaffii GS115]CCA39565.1 Small GTPase of the Rho/Rac subfamily of Ras-like proteins [Komagataella phaffii CBS 7435]